MITVNSSLDLFNMKEILIMYGHSNYNTTKREDDITEFYKITNLRNSNMYELFFELNNPEQSSLADNKFCINFNIFKIFSKSYNFEALTDLRVCFTKNKNGGD